MTVTISRLYDSYPDAEKAVRGLEAAGVPHSDISIVANNRIIGGTATRKSTVIATVSTIAPKALERAPVSVPVSAALPACSPAWACWRFRDLALWWLPAGSLRLRLAPPPVRQPAALSVR